MFVSRVLTDTFSKFLLRFLIIFYMTSLMLLLIYYSIGKVKNQSVTNVNCTREYMNWPTAHVCQWSAHVNSTRDNRGPH